MCSIGYLRGLSPEEIGRGFIHVRIGVSSSKASTLNRLPNSRDLEALRRDFRAFETHKCSPADF